MSNVEGPPGWAGSRRGGDDQVVPMVYWDPIRGLTVAEIEDHGDGTSLSFVRVVEDVERMMTPLMTMPPEAIVLGGGRGSPIVLGKVTMPLGEIPKPLFKVILMNVIHGLARLRWDSPWRGFTYNLYRMASSSKGTIDLWRFVDQLLVYLSRIWALIICNSIVFNISLHNQAYKEYQKLRDVYKQCHQDMASAFMPREEGHPNKYDKVIEGGRREAAIRMATLRDLFLISIMLGKVNYLYPDKRGNAAKVIVIARQSRLEEMESRDQCSTEPDTEAFNLLFGDPTGLAVIPLIASISRVYGGKLWPRIPRLYLPYIYTKDCKRMNLIEVIDKATEPPPGTPMSMQLHGQPESSLFMEALDVYSNSLLFMPWERSAMLTIFTRYLARGLKKLSNGNPLHIEVGEDPLVIPIGEVQNQVYKAIVFKRRMLHATVEDLDTIAAQMIEGPSVEAVLPRIVRIVRSHIENISSRVTRVLAYNYKKYLDEVDKPEIIGIAYEVLNPLIDLAADSRGLARVVAIEPRSRRRLVKNLIDRLTESEYTRIFIYLIVDARKTINKKTSKNNDSILLFKELNEVAHNIINQDKNKYVYRLVEEIKLDMLTFEYELY